MKPSPQRWDRWLGRRLDWLLASGIATFVFMLFWAEAGAHGVMASLPLLAMGSLPILCLLVRPSVWSMAALVFVGGPCCCGAGIFCDSSSSPGTGVVHPVETYLIIMPLYGFLRAVHLAGSKP